jgi:hypothetical protein
MRRHTNAAPTDNEDERLGVQRTPAVVKFLAIAVVICIHAVTILCGLGRDQFFLVWPCQVWVDLLIALILAVAAVSDVCNDKVTMEIGQKCMLIAALWAETSLTLLAFYVLDAAFCTILVLVREAKEYPEMIYAMWDMTYFYLREDIMWKNDIYAIIADLWFVWYAMPLFRNVRGSGCLKSVKRMIVSHTILGYWYVSFVWPATGLGLLSRRLSSLHEARLAAEVRDPTSWAAASTNWGAPSTSSLIWKSDVDGCYVQSARSMYIILAPFIVSSWVIGNAYKDGFYSNLPGQGLDRFQSAFVLYGVYLGLLALVYPEIRKDLESQTWRVNDYKGTARYRTVLCYLAFLGMLVAYDTGMLDALYYAERSGSFLKQVQKGRTDATTLWAYGVEVCLMRGAWKENRVLPTQGYYKRWTRDDGADVMRLSDVVAGEPGPAPV